MWVAACTVRVVARLPLAPASGTRRGRLAAPRRRPPRCEPRPPCYHSLFESPFESSTRPAQWVGPGRGPSGSARRSHWERATLPVGARERASETWARSQWDLAQVPLWEGRVRVGLSKRRLEKRVVARGRGSLAPHWVPRWWRGALAGSHSPARGALRVRPLGGRATTVCARHFLWRTFLPSTLPTHKKAVWRIPHRGYWSSFLINYFRQKMPRHVA